MSDDVIVNLGQGALRGRRATTKSGGSYFSFQGIPYAQPPIGRLRFKAPQAPEPWSGIRNAEKEGNICPQFHLIGNEYRGDEDCLFLNVYSPQLPSGGDAGSDNKAAVMVFIHGGGFVSGSGDTDVYGPDFLVDQEVVVVTFNYRLGIFGFLSTDDAEIPGNAGMKDQVAALRWVQQNIALFGGDPNNVTIFGESAGGASVHYHLLSPMSKGLFHRAISQSGSALNGWAFSSSARTRTIRLAQALGCNTDNTKDVLDFLREIPAKQLVESLLLSVTDQEKRRGIYMPFVPVSEQGSSSGEEKFLLDHPLEIIKSGKFNRVPYITGVNTQEGFLLLKEIAKNPDVLAMIGRDLQGVLPEDMYSQLDTDESRNAAQKLKHFYFGDKELNKDTMLEYAEMNGDAIFVHKIRETAKLQAANSTSPVYCYQFAFDGKLGIFKKLIGIEKIPGVCHADELGYLFNPSLLELDLPADSPEIKVRNMFVKMWTNFAKTGQPIAEIEWEPVSKDKLCYLRIDQDLQMLQNIDEERMAFWDELYREAKSD